MLPYQEDYIRNCARFQELTQLTFPAGDSFDDAFDAAMDNMRLAEALSQENTRLLQQYLFPTIDDLYGQDRASLDELEAFADALSGGSHPPDLAVAEQILTALVSAVRRLNDTEGLIRLLYKLGMCRYSTWNMLTGLEGTETGAYSSRMRFCFSEASSYLKYFDTFSTPTKSYILRSLGNLYLGYFASWEDRLNVVRHTMQVFQDELYHAAAPELPWDRLIEAVRRQIITIIPQEPPPGSIQPDAIEDVMEAAHVVYELQFEKAAKEGVAPHAQRLMPYYRTEFACGLRTKESLLAAMEHLMDDAVPGSFDDTTSYRVLSMPAFYAQYLRTSPELLAPRADYLTTIYERAANYISSIPDDQITSLARLYIRQILTVFCEIPGGISFRQFLLDAMSRLAPELYAHGYAVGRMAQAVADTIYRGEPGFFDDIPELGGLSGDEQRRAVQGMALNAGMLHDVGKLNFTDLYNHAGRQLLSTEEAVLQLHTNTGVLRLRECSSTKLYTDVALGHHRWYDGSGGFPDSYCRKDSPVRALVDIVAFADYLDSDDDDDTALPCRPVPFETKIREAVELSGRRFSPLVVGWLHTPELLEALKAVYDSGRREGYYFCFRRSVQKKKKTDQNT